MTKFIVFKSSRRVDMRLKYSVIEVQNYQQLAVNMNLSFLTPMLITRDVTMAVQVRDELNKKDSLSLTK